MSSSNCKYLLNRIYLKIFRMNVSQCSQSCIPRRSWPLLLITFSIFITLGLFLFYHALTGMMHEKEMQEMIAVMRTRLKFLDSQYQDRKQDIIKMQAVIEGGYSTPKSKFGNSETSTHSQDLEKLLKHISGSKASNGILSPNKPEPIKAPFSLRIVPHLMDHQDSLRPAYQLRAKHYADYIIGIPHVKRDKKTYLFETIKSLLEKSSAQDKNYMMIVVMIGEINMTYVLETAHKIETQFSEAVDAGLIEVVSPSKHYYPDLDKLPANLGDSFKRFKWRTKQNLDLIFLMAFAQSRCLYYLMLEDDVRASDDYMNLIRRFTSFTTFSIPDWIYIQYSTTGGIGKLFRSTDLAYFLTYMQLFYSNMPIDWLTESYLADRACNIFKFTKDCIEAKKKIRPTYKINLFEHIGVYSSLTGKLHKIKGSPEEQTQSFDYFPHENPAVSRIVCDLIQTKNHSIQAAYNGDTFFWGLRPKADDVIEFWFERLCTFGRYLVRSGNLKHVNDLINKAVFEILPTTHKQNGSFVTIDEFDEFGMIEGQVDSEKYGDLLAMRIRFLEKGKFWVAITEIEFVHL